MLNKYINRNVKIPLNGLTLKLKKKILSPIYARHVDDYVFYNVDCIRNLISWLTEASNMAIDYNSLTVSKTKSSKFETYQNGKLINSVEDSNFDDAVVIIDTFDIFGKSSSANNAEFNIGSLNLRVFVDTIYQMKLPDKSHYNIKRDDYKKFCIQYQQSFDANKTARRKNKPKKRKTTGEAGGGGGGGVVNPNDEEGAVLRPARVSNPGR